MLKEHEKADAIEKTLREAYELGYSAGLRDMRDMHSRKESSGYNPSIVWALAQNLFHRLLGR